MQGFVIRGAFTSRTTRVLLGLLLFNGVTATVGGLALMTEWIPERRGGT